MKHLLLSIIGIILLTDIYSQPVLQSSYNVMREGDKLIKQQVEYISPGESGSDLIWDFSNQQPINEHYELKYYLDKRDSITLIGQEHRTFYKYLTYGDTLFISGYENSLTLMNYHRPKLLFTFPFNYQNQIQDHFYGVGEYTRSLRITVQGIMSTEADAYGKMILPEGILLDSVLRIHTREKFTEYVSPISNFIDAFAINTDSIDYRLANDSTITQVDTYRWYADGYRYPVFETVQVQTYLHGQLKESFNTAFCYTPVEQYYGLNSDPENREKRERYSMKNSLGDNIGNPENEGSFAKLSPADKITYCIQTERGNFITLDYELNYPAEISVILLDPQGRILDSYPPTFHELGTFKKTISLAGRQRGEYLLRIIIDKEILGEKILN